MAGGPVQIAGYELLRQLGVGGMSTVWLGLQQSLDRDGATMSEADRRNKERDLANMTRDLQRSQREFREDLNLRKNEELASMQERANKVIQQIAVDEKFDLIVQEPVIYASPRIDITDRVIKALSDK